MILNSPVLIQSIQQFVKNKLGKNVDKIEQKQIVLSLGAGTTPTLAAAWPTGAQIIASNANKLYQVDKLEVIEVASMNNSLQLEFFNELTSDNGFVFDITTQLTSGSALKLDFMFFKKLQVRTNTNTTGFMSFYLSYLDITLSS